MDKAVAKAATSSRSVGADARDAFVLLAMSVVAAALGLGLYLQFEAGFVVAVVTATAAYLGLVTVHVLVRRARAVVDLQAEIQRLNAQIAHLKRAGHAGRPQEETVAEAVASSDREKADGSPSNFAKPVAEERGHESISVQGYPALSRQDQSGGRETARSAPPPVPPVASMTPDAAQAAVAAKSLDARDSTERDSIATQPKAAVAGASNGPKLQPPTPSKAAAAAVPPPPPAQPRRAVPSAPATTAGATPRQSPPAAPPLPQKAGAAAKPGLSSATPASSPEQVGDRASARSSLAPAPTLQPPPAARPDPRGTRRAESEPALMLPPKPTAAPGSPSGQPPPALRDSPRAPAPAVPSPALAAAHRPPLPAPSSEQARAASEGQARTPPPAAGPAAKPASQPGGRPSESPGQDGREFENMQVLIKQLAAQLNAAQPPDLAGLADPEQGTADGSRSEAGDPIDQSVAALRETAETMRRADQPKPPVRGSSLTPPPQAGLPAAAAPLPPRSTSATPSPYGRLALIAEAIEAERIDVYLDPILALGERRARHFEVSVRLRTETNEEIDADYYTSIAAETGLLARIDSAKLARTAAVANRLRARGSGGSLFATLAGESLADDGFLNAFADVFAKDDGLGSRLVLTFTQDDVRAFSEAHWDAVSTMAEIGLRFSLEDVSDLDMDFERLKKSGFDFVKLEAQVFLEGLPSGSGNVPASDLCRHLSGLGLALVVGRITEERDLAKIMGFGVLFGQGMLFGAPRPVKVDLRPAQAAA